MSYERNTKVDIEQIDSIISKLDYIGCNTKRVKLEKELCSILYKGINKEVI